MRWWDSRLVHDVTASADTVIKKPLLCAPSPAARSVRLEDASEALHVSCRAGCRYLSTRRLSLWWGMCRLGHEVTASADAADVMRTCCFFNEPVHPPR